MSGTNIPSTPFDGNFKAVLVPAILDVDKPMLSEASAASAIEASCYFTGDGLAITVDEQTITDERLCSTSTFEKRGRKTHAIQSTYIDNTNSPAHSEYNAVREACNEGATHFLITRRNIPFENEFAEDQLVRVYPIECGFPAEVPAEANSVTRTTQKWFVTGDPGIDVALVGAGG